ncbi:MAG: hypothetical protein ACON4U_13975 [Myxococcota bacterium]
MSDHCVALGLWLLQAPSNCQMIEVDAAARFRQDLPMAGIHRAFDIPRARIGLGLSNEKTHVRAIWGSIRSAGDTSYIGIDGESFVPQLQLMELAWQEGWVSLRAGLIDDLWVVPQNNRWILRSITADMNERLGIMGRSDLGGMVSFSLPSDRWNIQIQLRSGEGHRLRERNSGQNVVLRSELKPLSNSDWLSIAVFTQEGSRGFGLAREHRLGAQIYSQVSAVRFGVEGLKSWGVQGDSYREPFVISGWGQFLPESGFQAFLKTDVHREFEHNQQQTFQTGFGYRPEGDLRIWLGFEHNRIPSGAGLVPGASALGKQQQIYIQLDGQFRHKQFSSST